MANSSEQIPYLSGIPEDVLERVRQKLAARVSFGAGPSCVGGGHRDFDLPVPLEEALRWFTRYLHVLRRAHVAFVDGSGLWFDGDHFWRYDPEPHTAPQAGVTVRHPAEDGG